MNPEDHEQILYPYSKLSYVRVMRAPRGFYPLGPRKVRGPPAGAEKKLFKN